MSFTMSNIFHLHSQLLFLWITLQPDISAPAVQILAAYTGGWGPSNHPYDHRFVKYNILSGTSMASAFAAGAAAYVRSFHPDWSPSSIKSALMTTGNLFGFP